MAPAPPLPVTEDTPPDMLAGSMDLRVVLPGGRVVKMSAERCTPMMDLLVQVTTANKMAPGSFVLQPVGERGVLPYKPSTPIGALDTWTIQIVPKARTISTNSLKKAPLKPNNQQPFEQTFRLQVHLPRNQLFVTRVSPKSLLSDILTLACTEKNLDPNKYELRHPANLGERLKPEWTLADYKLQEVTLVAKGNRPLGSGLSSSDIMALQKEEEKRRQHARANGGTASVVLGLMLGKNSQSSGCEGSISSDSLGGRSISPARSDETPSPPGSSLPPPRPTRKRRPAPKPPSQVAQPPQPQAAVISHSRNSSDSSGYHEASILSESPESNGLSSPSGTLPRRSKLPTSTAQPSSLSTTHNLSRSLSNLAHMNNGDTKSGPISSNMKKNGHSISTTSLASTGHGKKKKAPPPPPARMNGTGQLIAEKRTASLSTLSSQSSGDSFDRKLYSRSATLERPSSSQSSNTSNAMRHDILPEESACDEIDSISSSQDENSQKSVDDLEESSRTSDISEREYNPKELAAYGHKSKVVNRNLAPIEETNSHPDKIISYPENEKQIQRKPQIEANKSMELEKEAPIPTLRKVPPVPLNKQPNDLTATHPSNVASPRASLPDVVSANEALPTPQPRVLPKSRLEKEPPTPSPRLPITRNKNAEIPANTISSLVSNTELMNESDGSRRNSRSSRNSISSNDRGSVAGMFGVGKTMVMLAATDSSNGSLRESKSSIFLDSDQEMTTRFGTDNDEEYDDGLNINENDLEMFEVQSSKSDSLPRVTTVNDNLSLLDSISVASSVFDSEHETSDGTWDKSSVGSRDFMKQHLAVRSSIQHFPPRETKKLRTLSSLEDMPPFLEKGQNLGRWPRTEDLHADIGKYPETGLQKESDEIDKEFESVTNELQKVILAEEAKQESSKGSLRSPKTVSPSPSVADWEYHLPAPPSAFRDAQSPISTVQEIENSSEIPVSEELSPEVLPPAAFTDVDNLVIGNKSNIADLIMEKECPLIQNLVKGVTKVNPLFNNMKYDAKIYEDSHDAVKENAPDSESGSSSDDWNPQEIGDDQKLTSESHEKTSSLYSSVQENNKVNRLRNFTISAYQRSSDMDVIFNGEREEKSPEFDFKKPLEANTYKQNESNIAKTSKLPRNNSFSVKNNLLDRSPVKRSTSHISLVANSGRTLRAKSIGNLASEISREEYGLHIAETGNPERRESLRKTTSEANINQDYGRSSRLAELQDQFLQWQEQLLLQTQPDIPLQSLQVLRSILSPSQEGIRDKTKENKSSECSSPVSVHSSESRNEGGSESSVNENEVQLRRRSSNSLNDMTKRYSYQGPPAVNFSTWSERPRSQVSIKVDNDYRIGKGQNPIGSSAISKGQLPTAAGGKEMKDKKEIDEVDCKVNSVALTRSESLSQVNGPVKVEPTALTMRIISHTTPSGFKKASVNSNFTKSQDFIQAKEKEQASSNHHTLSRVHSYSSAQIADPSRVPIVRAVELKKSFLQGQQLDGSSEVNANSSKVKLSWNEMSKSNVRNDFVNGNNDDENEREERFQGVNNLAKRFSMAASSSENIKPNHRPSSTHVYSESKVKVCSEPKGNPAGTNSFKDMNNSNVSSGPTTNIKKYTSVVGLNGIQSTGTFKEPQIDTNKSAPKVTITAAAQKPVINPIARSNVVMNNSRHPMPVVKGFRFATHDYSDSSLVAADSYKVASNAQPPVTIKVQHSNSFVHSNQRNSVEPAPSVSVRIQPVKAPRPTPVPSNVSQKQTVPPCAPPLPKKTLSRPKSFPAPEVNVRDQLMDAIRSFGGQGNLRQTNAI